MDKPPTEAEGQITRRVERLREAVGRSGGLSEVARKAGLAPTSVQNYLGGRDMKVGALVAISAACGVSIEWLATGRGPETSKFSAAADELVGFGPALTDKAHYWALHTLIRSCKEFHEGIKTDTTLIEVFTWIARYYDAARRLPDLPIEFKDPSELQ